jgi:hypothetical protein
MKTIIMCDLQVTHPLSLTVCIVRLTKAGVHLTHTAAATTATATATVTAIAIATTEALLAVAAIAHAILAWTDPTHLCVRGKAKLEGGFAFVGFGFPPTQPGGGEIRLESSIPSSPLFFRGGE